MNSLRRLQVFSGSLDLCTLHFLFVARVAAHCTGTHCAHAKISQPIMWSTCASTYHMNDVCTAAQMNAALEHRQNYKIINNYYKNKMMKTLRKSKDSPTVVGYYRRNPGKIIFRFYLHWSLADIYAAGHLKTVPCMLVYEIVLQNVVWRQLDLFQAFTGTRFWRVWTSFWELTTLQAWSRFTHPKVPLCQMIPPLRKKMSPPLCQKMSPPLHQETSPPLR